MTSEMAQRWHDIAVERELGFIDTNREAFAEAYFDLELPDKAKVFSELTNSNLALQHSVPYTRPLPSLVFLGEAYLFADDESRWRRPWMEGKAIDGEETSRWAHLINQLLIPMSGLDVGDEARPAAFSGNNRGIGCCASAESYFADLIEAVSGKPSKLNNRVSVYTDKALHPLVLRKSYEERSGITLAPLIASDVKIPAGTIVGLGGNVNEYCLGKSRARNKYTRLETYMVEEPIPLQPVRISPWAFSAGLARTVFAVRSYGKKKYDSERAGIVINHSLRDFRDAASRVMQLCGVVA